MKEKTNEKRLKEHGGSENTAMNVRSLTHSKENAGKQQEQKQLSDEDFIPAW